MSVTVDISSTNHSSQEIFVVAVDVENVSHVTRYNAINVLVWVITGWQHQMIWEINVYSSPVILRAVY